jgi:AhpD family alkylhydroperoxidase
MSETRVPKAEITGLYGYALKRFSRKMLGDIPEPAEVMLHNRPVLKAMTTLGQKAQKWDQLDPNLKSFAHMAVAAQIGCSWCLDFGYFLAHEEGLTLEKVREVPRWRDSDAFTDLERDVMAYAEAMTATPPTVSDEMVAGLDAVLGHEAMVELTMIIAVENERSRFNAAVGLASQGYADRCELAPLAVGSHA